MGGARRGVLVGKGVAVGKGVRVRVGVLVGRGVPNVGVFVGGNAWELTCVYLWVCAKEVALW